MLAIGQTARIRTVRATRRSAKCWTWEAPSPWKLSPAMHGLVASFNRIALGNPICSQIVSEIQGLHVGEAQVLQLLESWSQVGTTVPRTTAAVQNDSLLLGE